MVVKKLKGVNTFGLYIGQLFKNGNEIFLIDEMRNVFKIGSLSFLNKYFNANEGDIEYPRVWEDKTEQIKATTGKTEPKSGDIVIFGFIGGRVNYPIILGSISQINLFGDKYRSDFEKFIDMQEARHLIKSNIKRKIEIEEDNEGKHEKTITTYVDIANEGDPQEERGTIKLTIGKDGEIVLDIAEIAEKTGTGNLTLNLKGNDGQTNGNVTLNFNGKLSLINTDDEGAANGNKIVIDNTDGDEKISIEDKHGNKFNSTKDGITIDVVGDVNVNASGNALISAIDTKIGGSDASQAVCLKGLSDWILTHNHMGNMGAPTPVFPADLAALQAILAPGGGGLSNKANETVEVAG